MRRDRAVAIAMTRRFAFLVGSSLLLLAVVGACSSAGGNGSGAGGNANSTQLDGGNSPSGNGGGSSNGSSGSGGTGNNGSGSLIVPDNPTVECSGAECADTGCEQEANCVLVCHDECSFYSDASENSQIFCEGSCTGSCDYAGCSVACTQDCVVECGSEDCTVHCAGDVPAAVCSDGTTKVCPPAVCPEDQGMTDAGGPTVPTPAPEGCYQPYQGVGEVGICDPNAPAFCSDASWVIARCTDGRVFETTCDGSCECSCAVQGTGAVISTCTADPQCFGGACSPVDCGDAANIGYLACCSDADCFAGLPYCRDHYCASSELAGVVSTSCDPCEGVTCAENQTCIEGSCHCTSDAGCGAGETCTDGLCHCGNGSGYGRVCESGETCVNDTCMCGVNPACGKTGRCANDECVCGRAPPCAAGTTCNDQGTCE